MVRLKTPPPFVKIVSTFAIAIVLILFIFILPSNGLNATPNTSSAITPLAAVGPNPSLNMDWVTTLSPIDSATADINHDGLLDIAFIADNAVHVIYNDDGDFPLFANWTANNSNAAKKLAWGDVDQDGDLDLAVAIANQPNKLYLNQNGQLNANAIWSSNDSDNTQDIAWGDLNSDGWLDLVAGSDTGYRIYQNSNGILSETTFVATDASTVALGDVDNDNLLDLAISDGDGNLAVYLNVGGTFALTPTWQNADGGGQASLEWGDIDNDNDLDLAVTSVSRTQDIQ